MEGLNSAFHLRVDIAFKAIGLKIIEARFLSLLVVKVYKQKVAYIL